MSDEHRSPSAAPPGLVLYLLAVEDYCPEEWRPHPGVDPPVMDYTQAYSRSPVHVDFLASSVGAGQKERRKGDPNPLGVPAGSEERERSPLAVLPGSRTKGD